MKTLGFKLDINKKNFFLTGFQLAFFNITGTIFGVIFSLNIEKLRSFLSATFNFELFPSDVYLLEQLPSEINIQSILVIFIFSLAISALASYFPALSISKMKTLRALRYE